MEKLHFSIAIKASKEKVWDTMLTNPTYQQWTTPFMESSPNYDGSAVSTFEGSWEKGSKITFVDSEGSGMLATIADNRPYEFISIKHIGIINKGVEDTTSEEVAKWVPAFENYTFEEKDGVTTVMVDMDINSEHKEMFDAAWPKALEKLKELSEK